eukprot:SAG22_NODE_19763_length_272_cov_0.283237_1_plen_49_part_10
MGVLSGTGTGTDDASAHAGVLSAFFKQKTAYEMTMVTTRETCGIMDLTG